MWWHKKWWKFVDLFNRTQCKSTRKINHVERKWPKYRYYQWSTLLCRFCTSLLWAHFSNLFWLGKGQVRLLCESPSSWFAISRKVLLPKPAHTSSLLTMLSSHTVYFGIPARICLQEDKLVLPTIFLFFFDMIHFIVITLY